MKKSIFRGKSTHTKIFALITLLGVVLIIGLNILLANIGLYNTLFFDMTTEGINSLSSGMQKVCDELLLDSKGKERDVNVEFTFCSDPDYIMESDVMRPTFIMALRLAKEYGNVSVSTVNIVYNPTAVSAYKTTSRDSIKETDVIVSYGNKYRVIDATTLWTSLPSYNGEYRIATALSSLIAIEKPKAYFVTDHGETYYDPNNPDAEGSIKTGELADLIADAGMSIHTLALSELTDIPADCALLIINNPTSDLSVDEDRLDEYHYASESEVLDRYLYRGGSIIINKDPEVTGLTNLENFVAEWGITFNNELVQDTESCVDAEGFAPKAVYQTDETEYGYAYYSAYANLTSAPPMVFQNTGYLTCSFDDGDIMSEPGNHNASRSYAEFIGTSKGARAYSTLDGSLSSDYGYKCLAAASVRDYLDPITANHSYSYMFCTNSAEFFSNELLGSGIYANRDIVSTLLGNLSRTDRFADINLGGSGSSWNAGDNYGGKLTVSTEMTEDGKTVYLGNFAESKNNASFTRGHRVFFTILVMLAPTAALVLGVIVFIRRRFL